jgi:hypothetical protein
MGRITIACFCALTVAALATAAGDKITEPETDKTFETVVKGASEGVQLTCTGVACRKKTAFAAKVYAIAHWIDAEGAAAALSQWRGQSGEALADDQAFYDALCGADVEKRLKLVFVRNVKAKQVREGFEESLVIAMPQLSREAQDFLALFQSNVKKGQSIEIRSLPGGIIEASQDGKKLGRLEPDLQLATDIWKMYFQKKLVDNHLEAVKPRLISRISSIW